MASSDLETLRKRIDWLAADVERKVIDWRDHLHAHPELSN
ncbi:hypothetical protein GCM10023353_33930 [Tomitella cavernea]|uniref:Amidohydrolase n=1 Tax=Tomitella cavernea TaxID=1387982 RepID=A0ABP9CZ35_9ACTN